MSGWVQAVLLSMLKHKFGTSTLRIEEKKVKKSSLLMDYLTHFITIASKNYVHVKSCAQSQDTTLEKLR